MKLATRIFCALLCAPVSLPVELKVKPPYFNFHGNVNLRARESFHVTLFLAQNASQALLALLGRVARKERRTQEKKNKRRRRE